MLSLPGIPLYLTTSFAWEFTHGSIWKARQSRQQTRKFMDAVLRCFTGTLSQTIQLLSNVGD